jgi:hypothetical protein
MPWNKGEANSQAKLTEDQVRAIRRDTRACKVVGSDYGLSQAQVSRIRRRLHWKEVPDEPVGNSE